MVGYLPYIIFALTGVVLSIFDYVILKKNVRLILLIVNLLFFFFLAIFKGATVGLDTIAYSQMYESASAPGLDFFVFVFGKAPEILFYSFMYLFSNVLHTPEIVFSIFNYLIICFFLYLSFNKEKLALTKLNLFFFIGFFIMSFSGMRQAISISISTFAIIFLLNKKAERNAKIYFIYLAIIALAICFHSSALVLVFVPLLFFIRIRKEVVPWPLLFLFILPIINGQLFLYFSTIFDFEYQPFSSRTSITMVLVGFLILFYYLININNKVSSIFIKRSLINKVEYDDTPINEYIILAYFSCLFMTFNNVSSIIPRFSMHFYVAPVFILIALIGSIKTFKLSTIALTVILLFFAAYFIYSTPNLGLIPYVFR